MSWLSNLLHPKNEQKAEATVYGMSFHFGICAGPLDYVSRIFIDEKEAWPGTSVVPGVPQRMTTATTFFLQNINLFGGEEKEGGVFGNITYLPGNSTQTIPEALAEKFDRTTATMPAYRGIASMFFWQSTGAPHSDAVRGFAWRWNTPYLPGVWIEVGRASMMLGDDADDDGVAASHARIWRDRGRRSIHFALDQSGSMAGTQLVTLKSAMNEVLDIIAEQIAGGAAPVDIRISTFGAASTHSDAFMATVADIETLKDFVDALDADALDSNFYWAGWQSHDWWTTTVTGPKVTKRVNIVVTDGVPDGAGTPEELAASAAEVMSDELSRDGGDFNAADGTAVDCYGVNIELLNTTYTAYLDNTPEDGVPIVSGSDSSGLRNVILDALFSLFDSNPAHIIYECLRNPDWGMGAPKTAINITSFTDAAATLFSEQFGLSMIWTQESSIEDFITEVLDHIEGTLFVNPRDGLLTIKLIRKDYELDDLPVFTPDNSIVTSFSRKLWGETINEIIVTWTNPANEEEETVTVQDLANVESQGGIVSDGRNYYGVRRKDLAMRLAHRDLRSASTPLAKADMEINRNAWDLLPGDVCILDSPEDGIDQIVMRVGPVDYGKPGDSIVRTSLVEDVWALALAEYEEPPDTLWVDESEFPSPADHDLIFTLPFYLGLEEIPAATLSIADYPQVFAGVLAGETGHDTDTFDLLGQTITTSGTAFRKIGSMTIASHATLTAALAPDDTTLVASFTNRTQGHGPITDGYVLIEGTSDFNSELCLVADIGVSGYTLWRGILDTVPRAWPAGTECWFIDQSMKYADPLMHNEGSTVTYKILPRTSKGVLRASSAPVRTEVLNARPYLPLRPANVKVNGDDGFAGVVDCNGVDPIPVTWARRNRLTETVIIQSWTAADVTPETGQTTTVTLTDMAGVVLHTYSGITGTSQNVDPADFGGEDEGYIVVSSERDGLESLQSWRVHVLVDLEAFAFEDSGVYAFEDGEAKAFED